MDNVGLESNVSKIAKGCVICCETYFGQGSPANESDLVKNQGLYQCVSGYAKHFW